MRRRNVDASQIQVNNNPIDDLSVHMHAIILIHKMLWVEILLLLLKYTTTITIQVNYSGAI